MPHRPIAGCALVLVAGLFLILVPASAARGEEAQPAATPESHQAKGEVKYGDSWVSIDTLFKNYLTSRTELQGLNSTVDAARAKLMELQRRLSQMKGDAAAAERPTRAEFAKARNKQRDYKRALDAKPPQKPVLQQLPPQPRQPATRSRSSRSSRYGSGSSDYYDGADQQYDDAVRAWEARADAIKRQNDAAMQKYKQEMDEYKKNLAEAQKALPKIEATIKDCEAKLDESAKALDTRQAPLLEDVKKANEEVLGIQAQVTAVGTRVKNMADAIRGAPESVRYQHGVVEWEGLFYTKGELEKLHTDTQAEIDRVREKLKEESAKSNQPLPPGWRHPQQDRMDALKAILDKVKDAGGTTAKAAA